MKCKLLKKAIAPWLLVIVFSASEASAQNATTQTSAANSRIDTVNVDGPKVPPGNVIHDFVKSYAAPAMEFGKIPKWGSGICPITMGLTAEQNLGVTELLKQIATQVGAPVETKGPCAPNVTIIFTRTPQLVLDDIAKNHPALLGFHELTQTKQLTTMTHPIEAWYATATRDFNGKLRIDSAKIDPQCAGVNLDDIYVAVPNKQAEQRLVDPTKYFQALQDLYQYCGGVVVTGDRLNDGLRSEFHDVTIIADFDRVSGLGLEPTANYVAMLALSQTQAFETCQPLTSITNLVASGCDAGLKPDRISPNDIAFLSALYKMRPDSMLQGQQSDIEHGMKTALGGQ